MKNTDYQIFFKIILFQKGFLEETIKKSPRLDLIINNFFLNSYSYFLEQKDYPTAGFFLHMEKRVKRRLLSQITSQEKENLSSLTAKNNSSYLKKEQELFELTIKGQNEKNICMMSQYLILAYEDLTEPLNEIESIDLIHAIFLYKTYLHSIPKNHEIEHAIYKVINHKIKDVQAVLSHSILNQVLQKILPNVNIEKGNWEIDQFPLCHRKDSLYSIDIVL